MDPDLIQGWIVGTVEVCRTETLQDSDMEPQNSQNKDQVANQHIN